MGISTVTGIFFKLPAGAISDIVGRRRMILAGLLVFAFVPFLYLLVSDYRLLIGIRFLHGFATAIFGPVAMALVMDLAGGKKGEMLSWFSSLTIVGTLLGAPVGGFILNGATPDGLTLGAFQTAYVVSGVFGIASLLIALRWLPAQQRPAQPRSVKEAYRKLLSGVREVASDRRVLITSKMEGLQNMTVGALEAFLPIYAVTVAGLSMFQAGLLWGAMILVTIGVKPLMGRISDRSGRRPLIVAGMLLCAFSFAAIPLLGGFIPLLAAALVFGVGEALVTSSSAALVGDLCREKNFGAAMGTFGTIYDIGHAAGPILAGVLIAGYGYLPSFWIIAAVLILAVPVFTMIVREG